VLNDRTRARETAQNTLQRTGFISWPDNVGIRNNYIVILCEGWTSWIFACGALRIQLSRVYIWQANPSWSIICKQHYPSIEVHIGVRTSPFPDTSAAFLVLLEGSFQWLQATIPSLPPATRWLASQTSPESPRTSLPWPSITFDSSAAGSVLSSPWTFYHHHEGLTSIPPPLMYARTIQHIVDPTVRPSQRYPPHAGLPSNTHLALSQIFALFSCRSVFSRGGTVVRSLSPSELSRVYDLPPFLGSMYTRHDPATLPWLASCPVKLLVHVGHHFVSRMENTGPDLSTHSPDPSGSKTISSGPGTTGLTTGHQPDPPSLKTISSCLGKISSPGTGLTNDRRDWSQKATPKAQGDELHPVLPTLPRVREEASVSSQIVLSSHPEGPVNPRGLEGMTDQEQPPLSELGEMSGEEQEIWSQQFMKSVKADDATTPVHLWDERVWSVHHISARRQSFQARYHHCPLDSFRGFLLRRWKINVRQSFQRYLREAYGTTWSKLGQRGSRLTADLRSGRECLWHAMEAEWWEWSQGSRPFFWRWPSSLRDLARDGFPPYISSVLPQYTRPQPVERDPQVRQKVATKLAGVRDKRYVCKGTVTSLTSYFSVPKGDQDIRLVYDVSKSGLNKSLWAPNFGLPMVDTLTRGITPTF